MALQAAGVALVNGGSPGGAQMLGIRSLREEYLKPTHRADIARNLRIIEEHVGKASWTGGPVASAERLELPRFQYLFKGGDLLPAQVFVAALELKSTETINGRQLAYDADVLILRDNLVAFYKPLVGMIRRLLAKEMDDLPFRSVKNFTRAWTAWESAWLTNREVHAVEALQPLAKAILSLEPLLNSHEKERLLPWPREQHQKIVTLKCLEGFISSFSELAACMLPSLQRELDHDTRLLLLMDHVLLLSGNQSVNSCLTGLSTTPDVNFPDHQAPRTTGLPLAASAAAAARASAGAQLGGAGEPSGTTLDQYAFRLLGASVGDTVAQRQLEKSGQGSAAAPTPPLKESEASKRAQAHAVELLLAFEEVKDVLLSLKSTLEYIDPRLDEDEPFVNRMRRFERAFRKAKKLFLEPDNLA